jgi:hypothetical protein
MFDAHNNLIREIGKLKGTLDDYYKKLESAKILNVTTEGINKRLNDNLEIMKKVNLDYIGEDIMKKSLAITIKHFMEVNNKIEEIFNLTSKIYQTTQEITKKTIFDPTNDPKAPSVLNNKDSIKHSISIFLYSTKDKLEQTLPQIIVAFILDPTKKSIKRNDPQNFESLTDIFNMYMMKLIEDADYPDNETKESIVNDIRTNIIPNYMNISELTVIGLRNMIDNYINHYLENQRFFDVYRILSQK